MHTIGFWNLASAFVVIVTSSIVILAHYYECNIINHFTCEIQALLKIACSGIHVTLILSLVISIFKLPLFFTFIIPCFYVAVAVWKIHSMEARLKAFSSCRYHITVVTIFSGTTMYMYLRPQSNKSQGEGKFFSISYGVLTPMLNPLIYTLRNKNVKGALRKLAKRNEKS